MIFLWAVLSFRHDLNQIYIIMCFAVTTRSRHIYSLAKQDGLLRVHNTSEQTILAKRMEDEEGVSPHLSLANSQRGSSGRSYSGITSSCAELRRVVMRTSGVLEFMEELESADTYRRKDWLITAVWVHGSNKVPRHR